MKKLAAVLVMALGLGGCFGQVGMHSGFGSACTDRTVFGDCKKSCVRQQEHPTSCSCSKGCSCWPSHPGGDVEKAEK